MSGSGNSEAKGHRSQARPSGIKIIIAYKLAKAPLVLALAIWLTSRPHAALDAAAEIARELAEGGATWDRTASWITTHVTVANIDRAAFVAWLDAVSTSVEGILLLIGKSWGEWIVVVGLAAILPIEIASLARHAGVIKVIILAANGAIVAFLLGRRVTALRSRRASRSRLGS